jgi:phosphinothricin acetyltransferase
VKSNDALSICGIYNYYIKETVISFEETPISIPEMENRIQHISADYPWLVWEEDGKAVGYAYVNRWKERNAYRFSVEDSIYLKQGYEHKGIGRKLLTGLLEEVRKTRIHAVVAGITLPNEQSVALHEKLGFKKIAQFDEIGFKCDRWLAVGYWELILR